MKGYALLVGLVLATGAVASGSFNPWGYRSYPPGFIGPPDPFPVLLPECSHPECHCPETVAPQFQGRCQRSLRQTIALQTPDWPQPSPTERLGSPCEGRIKLQPLNVVALMFQGRSRAAPVKKVTSFWEDLPQPSLVEMLVSPSAIFDYFV